MRERERERERFRIVQLILVFLISGHQKGVNNMIEVDPACRAGEIVLRPQRKRPNKFNL